MNRIMLSLLLALAWWIAPAEARTVDVVVDARAGPWAIAANPNMPFGTGDQGAPVVVRGIEPDSGKADIVPSGTTSVATAAFNSIGDTSQAVDDTERKKKRYPSFYTPKILYPAYAHGLVASFVNDAGKVVSRPFMVGKGVRVTIPVEATGIALGFNDASFAANSGQMTVRLELPD